jgi:hypothetical protein
LGEVDYDFGAAGLTSLPWTSSGLKKFIQTHIGGSGKTIRQTLK